MELCQTIVFGNLAVIWRVESSSGLCTRRKDKLAQTFVILLGHEKVFVEERENSPGGVTLVQGSYSKLYLACRSLY